MTPKMRRRYCQYKSWSIQYDPKPIPTTAHDYTATHKDYDGPEDPRCITGSSIEDCIEQINELEEEQTNGR